MENKVTYFESFTPENTDATFELVKERLRDEGIGKLVLASTTGATAARAMEFFSGDGVRLVVVPWQFDFKKKGNPFPEDLVQTLRDSGHAVHFGTMLFHTDDFYGSGTPTQMANLLRCFSQGVKVCFEIVMMATDAGLLAGGEKVMVMAGTGRGSDTALVMQAASSKNMKRLRVLELICKPVNLLHVDESEE